MQIASSAAPSATCKAARKMSKPASRARHILMRKQADLLKLLKGMQHRLLAEVLRARSDALSLSSRQAGTPSSQMVKCWIGRHMSHLSSLQKACKKHNARMTDLVQCDVLAVAIECDAGVEGVVAGG